MLILRGIQFMVGLLKAKLKRVGECYPFKLSLQKY